LAREYTEQTPNPIEPGPSPAGVFLTSAGTLHRPKGGIMWWIFGIAMAVIVAAAYVLTRRPSRRTTIVLERD
jgi:hypothetical protein